MCSKFRNILKIQKNGEFKRRIKKITNQNSIESITNMMP